MTDPSHREFLTAVHRGDAESVKRLLPRGANPGAREESSGLTALMIAAGRGDAPLVRLLLDAGADLHTADSRGGATALHKAVQGGDPATVRILLEAGAFVDSVAATTGHTPLMDALWYKWPEVAAVLLERGAGLNLSTHYGFSMREHFEYELKVNTRGKDELLAAERLLAARTAADSATAEAQQLMAAVVTGEIGTVQRLLAEGAEVDARYPVVNGFNDAHTPLLVACRDGHREIARELLGAGADVNATEPTFGAVPLHKAVYNGHAAITALLVAAPGIDLDFQGITNGYTPLHDALWHGYEECARILLDAGARHDLVGHDGKLPADIAREGLGADHPLTRVLTTR
ncbi:ankyrin repeat domain-containing protein [Kitasatospora sp. NPDC048722]|uniref:ankyrin repeat domain-containing protein n=1 Tax=Kitasatospora sp. NPDC048722 TaxID=3155639 RepID=UPI0033DB0A4B